MVFSSPIFLFFFLPTLIVLYFSVPRQAKNLLLLSASLLFYAWGEGFYILLMLASIAVNYVFGRTIDSQSNKLPALVVGVALNLLLLTSYKYSNFLVENINFVLMTLHLKSIDWSPVHLPLGISFFTFQAISYLVDIYRKEISSQKSIINLGLYISLFPQLIAGPIVRYKTIVEQIEDRVVTSKLFSSGVERFIFGLAKKMLIANPLGLVVDSIFAVPAAEIPTYVAWIGVLCYALQIYFDFSGYSDMAIGLGRMFGFKFLENFNYPYTAQSLQDFWRRWHISLSTWFRDYLYIPLGGNRGSPLKTYSNLFVVFLLCGLWHGASWNFFIWGAFHGVILSIERAGVSKLLQLLWRPLRHLYLIVIVLVSWVFFRAETLTDAVAYLQAMFSINFGAAAPFDFLEALTFEAILALIVGLLCCAPSSLRARFFQEQKTSFAWANSAYLVSNLVIVFGLLFLSIMSLASTTHNPFIYFRF